MTDLAVAPADAPAPAAGAPAVAAMAARIPVPRQLPVRHDGQRLKHLSNSSYTLWASCPEAWRRRYILGHRTAQSAAMFLGSRVDDALSDYHQHLIDHGEALALDEVIDRYRAGWPDRLAAEQERRGVVFDEFDAPTLLELGIAALKVTFEQLVPRLGMPVAVQRRIEFKLDPALEWTVEGYLDLETQWPSLDGELVSEIVDYKVKGGDAINQAKADRDPQASLYLAGAGCKASPPTNSRSPRRSGPAAGARACPPRSSEPHGPSASCAQRSRGSRSPPARSTPTASSWEQTVRGGSRTRPAGAARRATASTGTRVRAAPACSRGITPPRRGLPDNPSRERSQRCPTRCPSATAPRPVMPGDARSKPACSAASPTTNALTGDSPATTPPDAAAGPTRPPP
jgi:hypothetical protein